MRMDRRSVAALSLNLLSLACLVLSCGAAQENSFTYELDPGPDRNGKPRKPITVKGWLPASDHIRGVICSDNIFLGPMLAKSRQVAAVAAELGIGILRPVDKSHAPIEFDGTDSFKNLDRIFAAWAAASKHPELEGAPIITIGHSTGGIMARNVVYADADRVIAVIHLMSGNLHQHIITPGPNPTLAGVPFLAVNGELEAAYPESGKDPRFENQTQWVMVRESLIERRMNNPAHLMNLLVLANGGHGSWSDELSDVCALFIKKATLARTPEKPANPSASSKCLAIKPESGWLTDANIKSPQFKPAPYEKYEGDSERAFWHVDEEMAQATTKFHEGKFTHPDPLWGPLDLKAVHGFNLRWTEGPDAAVKSLLALCDGMPQQQRVEAAGYLGRLGAPAAPAIPKLISMFGGQPPPVLTDSLTTALARLAPASTQPLLDATKDNDACIRAGAIRTLGRIGEPADKVLASVEGAITDKDPAVRHAAFGAMIAMKAEPARIGAAAAGVLDDLSKSGQAEAFSNTCRSVIGLGSNVLAAATPALIRAVSNPNASIFGSATEGILAVRPKPPLEAIPALSAAILTSDTNRWVTAVNAIARIDKSGETNIVLACVAQLRNKDAILGDFAVALISRLAPKAGTSEFRKSTVKTLLDILEGRDDSAVRRRAALSIGAFGPDAKDAAPSLKMALEDGAIKSAVQKALTDIGASAGPNLDAELP